MRRVLMSLGVLALLLGGCGQANKPQMVGGKPVSHWLQALQNTDAGVRKKALFKLGNAGTVYPGALPAIIGELKDRDPAVRCEAILALVKGGSAAKEALPVLAELQLRDRNAQVRTYAARAVEKLQRRT